MKAHKLIFYFSTVFLILAICGTIAFAIEMYKYGTQCEAKGGNYFFLCFDKNLTKGILK